MVKGVQHCCEVNRKLTPDMFLSDFNSLPPNQAVRVLSPCVDIPRWVNAIVARRPYANETQLFAHAASAAPGWTEAEMAQALSRHAHDGEQPGERPATARELRSMARRRLEGIFAQ